MTIDRPFRSRSAEQGKENNTRKSGSVPPPPPPPNASDMEEIKCNTTKAAYSKDNKNNRLLVRRASRDASTFLGATQVLVHLAPAQGSFDS